MLVLTRKVNQSIMIGEIEVIVSEIRGDSIRLGVNAPRHVAVDRAEIWQEKQGGEKPQSDQSLVNEAASASASTVGKTLDQVRRMQK